MKPALKYLAAVNSATWEAGSKIQVGTQQFESILVVMQTFLVILVVLSMGISSLSDGFQSLSQFLSIFWVEFHHKLFVLFDVWHEIISSCFVSPILVNRIMCSVPANQITFCSFQLSSNVIVAILLKSCWCSSTCNSKKDNENIHI